MSVGPERKILHRFDTCNLFSNSGPEYLVEGSFDGISGFDVVNRSFALALEKVCPGRVAVFPSVGRGRLRIDETAIGAIKGLKELVSRFKSQYAPIVNIRSFFPPRVLGMSGRVNVFYFPWEETLVPQQFVDRFNRFLDGVLVPSAFVKKALMDSGVSVPIEIVGQGVDQISGVLKNANRSDSSQKIRFLHVSSCLPRKGVDVLLKAYRRAFAAEDPVTLTIKTFPGELNNVQAEIEALMQGNPRWPEIVLINRVVAEDELLQLYVSSDALVNPSRGEGFGLPLGEAMLAHIPVITTGYGGQTDFCKPENTWLVDFTLEKAQSHFDQIDSVWAEPDAAHLAFQMRAVYEGLRQNSAHLLAKVEAARIFAQSQLRWSGTVERTVRFIQGLKRRGISTNPVRVTWVTPDSAEFDVAEYSGSLLRYFDSRKFFLRVYSDGGQTEPNPWDDLANSEHKRFTANREVMAEQILEDDADCVVIQHHHSLFAIKELACLVRKLSTKDKRIVLSLHSTYDIIGISQGTSLDYLANELALCDRILVKSITALNHMKALGLIDNVTLFPHGIADRGPRPKAEARAILGIAAYEPVIGSFGNLEHEWGVIQLIEAFPEILASHPRAFLLLINRADGSDSSRSYRDACLNRLRDLGLRRHVVLVDDLLTAGESLLLLEATDVVVFPAQMSDDLQIASVSHAFAAGRPILTTDTCAADEFGGAVDLLPGRTGKGIAQGLLNWLADPQSCHQLPPRRTSLLQARSWGRLSVRLQNMIVALVRDHARKRQ
ncbi:MAG: glycosyltransferase [Desulfomonilaceae bacterium]